MNAKVTRNCNASSVKLAGDVNSRTLKALNSRLLSSQFLSNKASGERSLVRIAEACCGINSQDYLESFDSFWARVEGFRDKDLLSELRPKGGLVRTWTVRSTMHTIPAKDYWVHVLGGPGRRFLPFFDRVARQRGIPDREFRVRFLYEPLLDYMKGQVISSTGLKEFVVERLAKHGIRAKMKLYRGWSSTPTYGPTWTGLGEMSHLGLIVSAGRRGSEGLWMRTTDWLDHYKRSPDPEKCFVELLRKYIESYGPVTREDIVYWSMLLKKDVDTAIESLENDLVKENFGTNQEYFSFGTDRDSFESPDVIILPEFDSLLMGYKDKSRIISRELVKKVFWGLGGIHRTILLDGFVAGIWKREVKQEQMTIHVEPFRSLSTRERRSISEAFERYAEYKDKVPTMIVENNSSI